MHVDKIRRKGAQSPVVVHDILEIQAVSALPKGGADARVQQKQLQDIFYLTHGGTADDGNFFVDEAILLQ